MGRKKSEYRIKYEEFAILVLGYDKACDYCTYFIVHRCLPCITTTEHETDRTVLVNILLKRQEALENYELCSKLFLYKNGFDIPQKACDISMERYIYNALAVLNYHVNIEECVEVFLDFGLLAFNPWIPSANDIDFIDVADRVIGYLEQRGELEVRNYILEKRRQILNYRKTGKLKSKN